MADAPQECVPLRNMAAAAVAPYVARYSCLCCYCAVACLLLWLLFELRTCWPTHSCRATQTNRLQASQPASQPFMRARCPPIFIRFTPHTAFKEREEERPSLVACAAGKSQRAVCHSMRLRGPQVAPFEPHSDLLPAGTASNECRSFSSGGAAAIRCATATATATATAIVQADVCISRTTLWNAANPAAADDDDDIFSIDQINLTVDRV